VRKPEVMSPAGYWPQLRAAIEAGADSVYFGLKHFTARAKVGFEPDELPEVMRTLHRRGVRGFVTFNTLVFDGEIDEAIEALETIARAGADAIIVQDPGILKLARELAPDLEIHASTQMSITDARGAKLARDWGVQRVTLARELSLAEIEAIQREAGVELEVFVHGALCVAYSGQCYSSEAWGGRSANRGQCAQACRLPYELIVDGMLEPLGDARYLLSPQDLFALHQVPELARIGVAALKIEGRYKDEAYVAAATAAYRQAVDEACAGVPLSISREEELKLEQVYSRGFGPHFISGTNHQAVVRGRAPRHRGLLMGRVQRIVNDGVWIDAVEADSILPLKPGDGVVFDASDWRSPQEAEEGGRIFSVERSRQGVYLTFGGGSIEGSRIKPGDWVWRTDDPSLEREWRVYTRADAPVRKQTLDVVVEARPGQPLISHWRCGAFEVEARSSEPLSEPRSRALSMELLRDQFGRLGGTAYDLGALELRMDAPAFAPVSLLNQVRRDAVEQLEALQSRPRSVECHPVALERQPAPSEPGPAMLHLLVRTPEQLDAALDLRPASITLDYLDLYGLKPSVERVRNAGLQVRVATPRVLKPGEERVASFLLRLDCPLLVRPAGLLAELASYPQELTGDFSLNAANVLTGRQFLSLGLARITPSHDLNAAQVAALAQALGAHRIEAIAYQHLPVFHTEHCVFCRFLSSGTSYLDCGRPCEKHRVELRDEQGRRHPVLADVGCRNTVFGAQAQEASQHLAAWMDVGVRHFRLEFAHEDAGQVAALTRLWQQAIERTITPRDLARELKRLAPHGTTQGSLFIPVEALTAR
jgi:putative protease